MQYPTQVWTPLRPRTASDIQSMEEPVMKLMITQGVISTDFHQCMYGLVSVDRLGPAPAKKPTRVLSSHPAFAESLSRQCDGTHRHAILVGKSACSRAAQYPRAMCDAMLKAVDVIKKSLAESSGDTTNCVWGSGEFAARRATTEPLQALCTLEAECQEEDDWHWQEDQDLH